MTHSCKTLDSFKTVFIELCCVCFRSVKRERTVFAVAFKLVYMYAITGIE